jgi:site-specific DNA-methyltransferase (adenine-specific)
MKPPVINRIVNGDCISGMAALPAGSVDLAFADPPFNIGYSYDVYRDRRKVDDYLDWSRAWIGGVKRVLKSDGTFWLAIGDEYAAELKLIAQSEGFHCRSWVIWYYTFGVNCKFKFSRSHVHLFHFVVDPEKYTFNTEAIRVPSARQLVYADTRANPSGRLPDDTWILRPQDCVDGFTPDEDTWYFPRVAGTFKEREGFHGCQMPEQLLGRIIRSCSNSQELVLDPFSGSATTLAVAKKLGRNYLGFELSEDYAKRGLQRLSKIVTGDALEGAPEPLVSAPPTGTTKAAVKGKSAKTGKNHPVPETSGTPAQQLQIQAISREQTSPSVTTFQRDPSLTSLLLAAYKKTYDGYSLDRVIADRKINSNFLDACREAQLPGGPADWNRWMFRLRKSGKLAHIPTLNRTQFDWRECDGFIDAAEIAWRLTAKTRDHLSLDEVLCNPELAELFDSNARRFAPHHDSLQYRWAALMLRKRAKAAREQQLAHLDFDKEVKLRSLDVEQYAGVPGIYLLETAKRQPLFVGWTFDLKQRFRRSLLDQQARAAWEHESLVGNLDDLRLRTIRLQPNAPRLERDLVAHQIQKALQKRSFLNAIVFPA